MAVRIVGANPNNYTAERILQVAMDRHLKDKDRGIPLRIIYLDWNKRKKQYHQATTKGGWDDVFITRLPNGGGLALEYKNPGALEWIKDDLTGEHSAMCAVTDNNLFLLASHYYDQLWTIRDFEIDKKVKEKADGIDENNKLLPHTFIKTTKRVNKKTGVHESYEETVESNMYEFHKHRREGHFQQHNEKLSIAPMNNAQVANINNEKADLAKKRKELDERESVLLEKEKNAGVVPDVIPPEEQLKEIEDEDIDAVPVYSEEDLNAMHFSKLRRLAVDKFGIDAFKMKKAPIMEAIQQIQNPADNENAPDSVDEDVSISPREEMIKEVEEAVTS